MQPNEAAASVRQGAAGFRLSIMADRLPDPQVDPRWMKYILAKGFIAVDGISLTVGSAHTAWWAQVHSGGHGQAGAAAALCSAPDLLLCVG